MVQSTVMAASPVTVILSALLVVSAVTEPVQPPDASVIDSLIVVPINAIADA